MGLNRVYGVADHGSSQHDHVGPNSPLHLGADLGSADFQSGGAFHLKYKFFVMAALIDITNRYHLPHHHLIPIITPINLWY